MILTKIKASALGRNLMRYLLIIVLAVCTTSAIELIYNYHAIIFGSSFTDITENVKINSGKYSGTYTFDDATYINKLKIVGDFDTDTDYTIEVLEENSFGKNVSESITDQIYEEFDEAFTKIGKNVKKISININNSDKIKIEQILLINQLEINKYRMLFFFVSILIIIGTIFFREILAKKLEKLFLVYALGFGIIIIVLAGPKYITWDEEIHYGRVYSLASKDSIEWSVAAWQNNQKILPAVNTKEELHMLKDYLNNNAKIIHHTEKKESGFVEISQRSYLGMALFYRVGEALDLSFCNLYMFGKIGNLLLYVLAIYLALRVAKERKILIFSISLLPTVLFQGSTYTYDGIVYSFMVLGVALLMNEFVDHEEINSVQMLAAIILIVLGSMSKAIYIPILLLILALPNSKFKNKKQVYIFKMCIVLLFILVVSTFILPVISNTIEGNITYGGDSRGGDTSVVRQLVSMIKHPVASIKLMIKSISTLDNFRNLGYAARDEFLVTNLMFLNFASAGILADKWSLLLIPFLCFLFLVSPRKQWIPSKIIRVWFLLVIFGTVVLIWLSMYLSFTPVGCEYISGVQARYYFPILLPIAYMISSNSIVCNIKENTYDMVCVIINYILIFECIYQLFLQGICS